MALSDLRRTSHRCGRLALVITMAAAVASCSHSTPAASHQFDDQKRVNVSCLNHQTQRPGIAYTGGTKADTSKILVMLHYYVANGTKPYCDGGHASDIDRTWAQLYVTLGGEPTKVNGILSSR